MTNTFKTILLAVMLLLGGSQVGYAQNFFKGMEAYNRGDFAAALREWRPLAEQGDAGAQGMLGLMYDYGRGVIEDDKEAVRWYRMSAEQGNTDAQFRLGWMYYDGAGVVQDKVYAYMWVNIVALNSVTTEYEDTVREIIASNSRRTFAKS